MRWEVENLGFFLQVALSSPQTSVERNKPVFESGSRLLEADVRQDMKFVEERGRIHVMAVKSGFVARRALIISKCSQNTLEMSLRL